MTAWLSSSRLISGLKEVIWTLISVPIKKPSGFFNSTIVYSPCSSLLLRNTYPRSSVDHSSTYEPDTFCFTKFPSLSFNLKVAELKITSFPSWSCLTIFNHDWKGTLLTTLYSISLSSLISTRKSPPIPWSRTPFVSLTIYRP